MSIQPSSSKAEEVIRCRAIRKTYGEGDALVQALKGVDLTIRRGELRLLMGPSGSGKTTLISIISGILTEVLTELELGDKIGKSPVELSGGQQQRVAIARAIVHSPEVIVCDEPTSFLDYHTGIKIMELLQQLTRKKGVTLIVVTHDPRIVPFADTIDHLEDGRIVPPKQ